MPLTDQSSRLPRSQLLLVFFGIQLALFLACFDSTSVSTATAEIANDLGAANNVGWVGGSYLVAQIATFCIASRLSDVFGRKAVLISAIAIFGVGDLLYGFARSPIWLFLARSVSGIGAGGITSLSMIIVSDIVSMRKRGLYQGFIGASVALGMAIGPFLGGFFSQKVTWRWTFWVPPPLAAITIAIIYFLLPLPHVTGAFREKIMQIDWLGSFLIIAAIVLLLVPVSGGGSEFAWNSALVIVMLAIGVLLLIAFIFVEAKFAELPVLPMHIFRIRTVAILSVIQFLFGTVLFGNLYILPLYTQHVLGYSPIGSGALLLPLVLTQTITSTLAGLIAQITGRSWPCVLGGFILLTISQGIQIMFDNHTRVAVVIGITFMQGFAIGFMIQTLVIAQAASPSSDRAVVTGARNFFRTAGGAIGLAISNSLLNNGFAGLLPSTLPDSVKQQLTHSSFQIPASVDRATAMLIVDAYANAMKRVFVFFFVPIAMCLILTFFVKDAPLTDDSPMDDMKDPEIAGSEPHNTPVDQDIKLSERGKAQPSGSNEKADPNVPQLVGR